MIFTWYHVMLFFPQWMLIISGNIFDILDVRMWASEFNWKVRFFTSLVVCLYLYLLLISLSRRRQPRVGTFTSMPRPTFIHSCGFGGRTLDFI